MKGFMFFGFIKFLELKGIKLNNLEINIKNPKNALKMAKSSILYIFWAKFEKVKLISFKRKYLAKSFIIRAVEINKTIKLFINLRLIEFVSFFSKKEIDKKYSIINIQNNEIKNKKILSQRIDKFISPNSRKFVE